jgi:oxygen-dependent protoporphyrinogen oxidase
VFEDGMEAFPEAIAAALGDAVRTNVSVSALSRDANGGDALVRITTAEPSTVLARRVVLATTAPEQARLVAPLSRAAAEILGAVRYVPMVVVAVGIPPGGSPTIPGGFGFLRGARSTVRILGATFASNANPAVAPPGHALLTVFVGGGTDPDAISLDDDAVRALVERDLSAALGGPVRPDLVSIHRWPRAIPVLSPGHRARVATAQRLLDPFSIALSGSHVTGVGVHACAAARA